MYGRRCGDGDPGVSLWTFGWLAQTRWWTDPGGAGNRFWGSRLLAGVGGRDRSRSPGDHLWAPDLAAGVVLLIFNPSDWSYRGPLKAVILDWAGTTVDYGSFAPTAVFLRLFESRGVPITAAQARVPMGLMKKDHLRAIAQLPEVMKSWQAAHGRPCGEEDIEALYAEFVPLQLACLEAYAEPIPGTLGAVAEIRKKGMRVGATTGYTREMMEVLVPEAARLGYQPDAWVCPDDVPAGRPYPWMIYLNAIRLQVYPMESMVKVGDTRVDIEEGLNAGTWTVGLTLSGNGLGLSQADVQALPAEELHSRRELIAAEFYRVGAHYVLDGIWDVPAVLDEIQNRLARGERP